MSLSPNLRQQAALSSLASIASGAYKPTDALAATSALVDQPEPEMAPEDVPVGTPQVALAPAPAPPNVSGVNKKSPLGQKAASLVKSYLGTPYVWGGESPGGFDCSGLLQYVWAKEGVKIPRVTYDQWAAGMPVGQQQLRPGDAVFFRGSDAKTVSGRVFPGHVGMYIGNGRFIEAPHTGANVRVSTLTGRSDYMGARRYG